MSPELPAQSDTPAIYPILARHQREETWSAREIVKHLQQWTECFVVDFKLDIPEVVISVDRLPRNRYGQFRCGYNGLGLRGEITINSRYVSNREPWEVLGTLLHELLHGWQQAHGVMSARNHHNLEFRKKALEFGLIIDRKGVTGYASQSKFKELLTDHGIETPIGEVVPAMPRVAAASKLAKWTCECGTNVRVGVADFRALCLKCNTRFVRSDFERPPETITLFPQ